MKITKLLLLLAFAAISLVACKDGYIDDITPEEPGPDVEEPEVEIKYPLEGTLIRVVEDVTPITIRLEASDDIELGTITVDLDGNTIVSFDEFRDYRKAIEEFTYDNLTNGMHTLTVNVTDLAGKSTSETVRVCIPLVRLS
jgi:hypothetical protein